MRPCAVFPLAVCLVAAPALAAPAPATAACRAESASGRAATVVELYTSEGCSSCPPADRWLSSLKGRPDVVALAFHVDYWDRLGWRDRFASAAFSQRQFAGQGAWGSRFAYTPQVVADGADWRRWPGALPAARPATVSLAMQREGPRVRALVTPLAGAPARLAAHWAVLEDGHRSDVRAGENAGASLRHDHVVRRWQAVAPWPAAEGARGLVLEPFEAAAPAGAVTRRVVLVVEDAASGRPVQALALGC